MKKPTVYISGPVTGMPNNNFEGFALAEEKINAMGYVTLNPMEVCCEVNPKEFATANEYWDYCMRLCLITMLNDTNTMVVTLDGWEMSRGAVIEVDLARKLGMPVVHIVKFLEEGEHGND